MSLSGQRAFDGSQTAAPNSTLAIASLVLGILGWTLLPIVAAVIAVITGHLAKNEIKKSAGQLAGTGMATAGLILGYSALIVPPCACLLLILVSDIFWLYGDRLINTIR
jgi:hypothetical protein